MDRGNRKGINKMNNEKELITALHPNEVSEAMYKYMNAVDTTNDSSLYRPILNNSVLTVDLTENKSGE